MCDLSLLLNNDELVSKFKKFAHKWYYEFWVFINLFDLKMNFKARVNIV